MDSDELRLHGTEMINFVANYWESLDNGQRLPLPDVKPGYIRELIPADPPTSPEGWERIFADIEPVVLRGNTHWQHPNFFAYYPTACSYASIIGDILSGGIAAIGFTWKSSPSMTELEQRMLDWLAKAIGLPPVFWNADPGPGIGMIQSTASDATLVALLSARARAVTKILKRRDQLAEGVIPNVLKEPIAKAISRLNGVGETLRNSIRTNGGNMLTMMGFKHEMNNGTMAEGRNIGQLTTFEGHDGTYFSRLVAYCSDQAHSSVDKGIMLSGVKMRKLPTNRKRNNGSGNFELRAETLEAAIKEDRANGLIPFILVLTVGTTNTCAVESCRELGPICNREDIWLHVDAAYAGNFLICEEFRYLSDGIELADSFNFNAHKAMMVNFDCSPMWFKNGDEAIAFFHVDPVYLKHEHLQREAYDYRHLQIALGRRFRALKIWFVFRSIGIQRIQQFMRMQNELAQRFAALLLRDDLFELFVPQHLGLVCFRMKTSNELNEALCVAINNDRRIHLVASSTHGTFFLRFAVCSSKTRETNIEFAVAIIRQMAAKVLMSSGVGTVVEPNGITKVN